MKNLNIRIFKYMAIIAICVLAWWLYTNSYRFITPFYIDYTLTSRAGNVNLRVPGRYVVVIPSSLFDHRAILKGGRYKSLTLEIPHVDMPVIDGYSMPIERHKRFVFDSQLLTLRRHSANFSDEEWSARHLEFATELRKLVEVPSELEGFKTYKPKNYVKNSSFYTYHISNSKKILFECPSKCSYTSTYNDKMYYKFSFNQKELFNHEKIDLSVRKMIQQFIDDAN